MGAEIQVTTREAATALGVSIRTVQRRAQRGQLAAEKAGGRWVIALPVQGLDDFAAFQIEKASELLEQGAIVATSRPGIYRTLNPDCTVTYLVDVAARTCTCKAGERGIRCYHLAAALMASAVRRAA